MFTPGQHVIYNGQLYTYGRDATSIGEAPRIDKNGKPYQCAHALVTPVGSSGALLVRRASLQAVADTVVATVVAGPASASPTKPADTTPPAKPTAPRPEPTPPAPATTHRPTAIDLIKADALDAQAERLEDYAKSLRSEARTLRGET